MAALVNIFKVKASIHVSLLTSNFQQTSIPNNHQKLPLQSNTSDNCPQVFRKLHQCHQKPILCNCLMKFTGKARPKRSVFEKITWNGTEATADINPNFPASETPTGAAWCRWAAGKFEIADIVRDQSNGDFLVEMEVWNLWRRGSRIRGLYESWRTGNGRRRHRGWRWCLTRSLSLSVALCLIRAYGHGRHWGLYLCETRQMWGCRGAVWLAHVCPG